MPPPPPAIGSKPITVSTAGISSQQSEHAAIAPQPTGPKFNDAVDAFDNGDRKTQKRAANRLSAQLSRKRKKQFIEELKEENDGLRRKELILKSIPDLVVVFDSSGKLWFVSESVHRFLDFTSTELEGTSFWDRLCGDSVRLLKAAFMDSLAARQDDSDTAPLGTGLWELRLVDKDGSQKVVSLNGVVHFAGERPECVCSIRPREEYCSAVDSESNARKKDVMRDNLTGSSLSSGEKSLMRVRFHPQQSVVSNDHSDTCSSSRPKRRANAGAVRISDSGNSSSCGSDSGSSDEMNAEVGAN
jgi:PAS domain S-box-containing protein